MPRLTKKELIVTPVEFNSFRLVDGYYVLTLVPQVLGDEHKKLIISMLKTGSSKPAILKEIACSEACFNRFMIESFGTKKLAEIRGKL